MIQVYEISTTWERDGKYRIAPAGLPWIGERSRLTCGKNVVIGDCSILGDDVEFDRYITVGPTVSIGANAIIEHGVDVGARAHIEAHVTLGQYSTLGEDVRIESHATIGRHATVGRHARVAAGAQVWATAVVGSFSTVGAGARVRDNVHLGSGAVVGPNSEALHDLGYADGYRKTLCRVGTVAYIGAGCHWFTLADALRHWRAHDDDRSQTLCLMKSAVAFAEHYGLTHE